MSKGCVGCQSGPLVGGTMFQKFGLTDDYWPHTGSVNIDSGRMRVTGKEEDRFVLCRSCARLP